MLTLILLAIANALMIGLFFITFSFLPPEVPIYYSHQWGEMQLGSKWELLLIPIIMISFYIFLNFYKKKAHKDENFILADIFSFINISQILFFCLAFVRIIFVVIW